MFLLRHDRHVCVPLKDTNIDEHKERLWLVEISGTSRWYPKLKGEGSSTRSERTEVSKGGSKAEGVGRNLEIFWIIREPAEVQNLDALAFFPLYPT